MEPQRIVAANPADLAVRAADWIAGALVEAIERRAACSLALAGGRTPGPAYHRLAGHSEVPWTAVSCYFGDERAVPADHPESNYRLAQETLLSRVAVPPVQIHRMEAERPDRDLAALAYEALLPDPLDILLLGIGADGHVASLFPGAEALTESRRRVVATAGGLPRVARLTITPPVIRAARRILVIAAGSDKAAAVAGALANEGPPDAVPARLARQGTWILDRAAASRLPGAPR